MEKDGEQLEERDGSKKMEGDLEEREKEEKRRRDGGGST